MGLNHGFAAQPRRPVASIDVSRELGLFAANSQGSFCLSIKHGELKLGREIALIWVPVEGEPDKPEIRRGKIIAKLTAPCNDANAQPDDSYYRVEAEKVDSGRIYFAVLETPNNVRVNGGELSARIGQQQLSFRSCTGTEGLHFSAWSGTPPKQRLVWQRYFYLGYDIEPTCVERDFKEIEP